MELKELQKKYGISDEDFNTLLQIYAKNAVRDAYSKAGKKGGGNLLKKRGKEYFKRISKLAVAAKRSHKNKK